MRTCHKRPQRPQKATKGHKRCPLPFGSSVLATNPPGEWFILRIGVGPRSRIPGNYQKHTTVNVTTTALPPEGPVTCPSIHICCVSTNIAVGYAGESSVSQRCNSKV
eukprot:scaffold43553_cov19-Tisochrysis_lutea.AAC.1